LTCTTPSAATIGTSSVAGNIVFLVTCYRLEFINVFQIQLQVLPLLTTYTVTVTGSNGCTATSSVIVGVNKTPPSANAGTSPSLTCTTPSATLGTSSVAGNIVFVVTRYGLEFINDFKSDYKCYKFNNLYRNRYRKQRMYGNIKCNSGCKQHTTNRKCRNKSPSLTCTTPSAVTLGTTNVAGNTYSWSPGTALSSSTISNPTTSATSSTTYTVTVTGSNGCTATSSVIVGVNNTPPTANAGTSPSLTCTTPSAVIGTTNVAGNTYSWSPGTALSSSTISNPTTSATTVQQPIP
jgi:hypothetical protein